MQHETPIIAVMLSGGGRTLLNLQDSIDAGALGARVGLVIASRQCAGAERAGARGLNTVVRAGDIPAPELQRLVHDAGAGWVVLAGYLRRVNIPAPLARRIINIHPALLPSFGGAGMYGERVHEAVLGAGCKVSGCTAHLCDDRYDTGPIVAQACCPVEDGDTPETLAARVFALECEVYPAAVAALVEGRVRVSADGRRATVLTR